MAYPCWDTSSGPVKCRGCRNPVPPGSEVYIKSKGVYYCADCGLVAENAPNEVKEGGIAEGLLKDLSQFPEEAADTAMAKAALMMARQLDDGDVAPREVPQYTKEIRLMILQVRELFPSTDDDDDTETRRERLNERRRREQGGI